LPIWTKTNEELINI